MTSVIAKTLLTGLLFSIPTVTAHATPPHYRSFKGGGETQARNQDATRSPEEHDILRIWVVYVGQGDGLLIQLPTKYNYDPDPDDDDASRSERIDVLIDGGAFRTSNQRRMLNFVAEIYPDWPITIEHAVITHHDSDHVKGLQEILDDPDIEIERIYHNGLASYEPGTQFFPSSEGNAEAITKISNGTVTRGMAYLLADNTTMKPRYLVNDLDQLGIVYEANGFQGVYHALAEAIWLKEEPAEVSAFDRVSEASTFINEVEVAARSALTGLAFELLWPLDGPEKYGTGWSETINGNSVTFRVVYDDFAMLFTGDHNQHSETELISHLGNNTAALRCDVLKVPHHGSKHNDHNFFDHAGAVLGVASMGSRGFGTSWKHPSTNIVRWSGGAHRVYSTHIQERRFNWDDMTSQPARNNMTEPKHILIETDGSWFRLVEVPLNHADLNAPPTVQQTRRGNGTRWIKAR